MNLKTKKFLPKSDLVRKYRQLVLDFGPGFHPDNFPEDYRPKLSKSDIADLDESLHIFHQDLTDQVYEIGNDVLWFTLEYKER